MIAARRSLKVPSPLARRWPTICAAIAAGLVGAVVVLSIEAPRYASTAQLFDYAQRSGPAAAASTQHGGASVVARLRFYAALVKAPQVTGPVRTELGLHATDAELASDLSASVPVDTVVINVTATSAQAATARDIAAAAAEQLNAIIRRREAGPDVHAPLQFTVQASTASLVWPDRRLGVGLGLVLGLLVGLAGAQLLDRLDERVDPEDELAAFVSRACPPTRPATPTVTDAAASSANREQATASHPVRSRPPSRRLVPLWPVIVAELAGAAGLGALSATRHGALLAAVVLVPTLLAGFVLLYRRVPQGALAAVWLLQVFQAPISAAFGYNTADGRAIRHGTDGLVVLLILLSALYERPTGLRRQASHVVAAVLLGLSAAGLASDVVQHVPASVSLVGWWLAVKIWILVLVTMRLPWHADDAGRLYQLIIWVGGLVAVLAMVDYAGHGVVESALGVKLSATPAATRFRSGAVQAIFVNPGECSFFLSLCAAIALASFAERGRRTDLYLFILVAVAVLLTLRLKGLLSIGAAVVVVVMLRSRWSRASTLTLLAATALAVVVAVAFDGQVITHQIGKYTGSGSAKTPRVLLYRGGFTLGAQHLPLGVGFGRYASDTAKEHYSPVYYRFGFNQIYGMSPAHSQYLDDTSWPAVIGESGYLGAAFVLAGFLWLAWLALRAARRGSTDWRWWGVAALAALAVTLINSLGTPTLFDWLAALTLALLYGPICASLESGAGNPGAPAAAETGEFELA